MCGIDNYVKMVDAGHKFIKDLRREYDGFDYIRWLSRFKMGS
jgi:hypothetical protein